MKIQFTLNGEVRCLETPADRRVVDLLRTDVGLTGTKESCGSGECGACSILVDGESRLSCLMLAAQLDGRYITTIEGVAADPAQAGLLDSFVRHGAVQCGYCSPGMVISAVDLLRRNPKPQRSDIRTALSGNLCRCTGYQKIVDAVAATAEARSAGRWEGGGATPEPMATHLGAKASRERSAASALGSEEIPVSLPSNGDELLGLADQGTDYRVLAGGTDLLVWRREHGLAPRMWVGLERVPELHTIGVEGAEIVIGAAATFQEIAMASPVRQHLGLLEQAIGVFGSPPIAHMATLGGNLCTASPAADSLPALYVLRAQVEIRSRQGRRTLPLREFITGPRRNALLPGEILWSVRVPRPVPELRGAYFKVGRRKALAIAVASLAAAWTRQPDGTVRQIRLAWGSVGSQVMVFPEIEQALQGQRLSVELLRPLAARVAALVAPIDDIRASAAYRRQVAGNLLFKLLEN